jgi:hypothetical protein
VSLDSGSFFNGVANALWLAVYQENLNHITE